MGCEDKLWLVWVKMATGYFQGFLLVLLFYSNLIGIKYGLHFSNHLKIKMLFNKEPIYWKKNINKKSIFRPNMDKTWFINVGLNVMVTIVRTLSCYCKCLSERSLLSYKWKCFKIALCDQKSYYWQVFLKTLLTIEED